MYDTVDVCIATDARFPGGSSSSTAEELLANEAFGFSTLFHQNLSTTLRDSGRPYNPKLQQYFRRNPTCYIWDPAIKRCRVLFFRQPSVVNRYSQLPRIIPEQIIVVVNHPMRNAHGRYDFDLRHVRSLIVETYGIEPQFLAISQIIRDSYTGKQKSLIDPERFWYNFFSLNESALSPQDRFRSMQSRPTPVIGRHSRDGQEKWPENAKLLTQVYPSSYRVNVLGGASSVVNVLGHLPPNWLVHEFGSMDVAEFLNQIDIFVYFHHSNWTEAFGRVIAEAMAAGIPAILPTYFKPLFGEGAVCCEPSEVPGAIKALQTNEATYVAAANAGRNLVREKFGWEVHRQRMLELLAAPRLATNSQPAFQQTSAHVSSGRSVPGLAQPHSS